MGRTPRILGEGITYHVMANCNNGEFLFRETQDFLLFLKCLRKAKERFGFDLNAYHLLQSHIHLILQTTGESFLDEIMHWLCRGYTRIYNPLHKRTGHFWRDRYKAKIIDNDLYGLGCLRYVHRNSFTAEIVDKIENWPWSCYTFYAFGVENDLITPLPSYLGLASNEEDCRKIYRKWVETPFLSKESEIQLYESKIQNNSRLQQKIIRRELRPFFESLITTTDDNARKVPGAFRSK